MLLLMPSTKASVLHMPIYQKQKDKAVVTTEHDYVVWDAEPIVECACLCEMSASNCARCITTYVWGQVISGHE